jgi:hypothetical protein
MSLLSKHCSFKYKFISSYQALDAIQARSQEQTMYTLVYGLLCTKPNSWIIKTSFIWVCKFSGWPLVMSNGRSKIRHYVLYKYY